MNAEPSRVVGVTLVFWVLFGAAGHLRAGGSRLNRMDRKEFGEACHEIDWALRELRLIEQALPEDSLQLAGTRSMIQLLERDPYKANLEAYDRLEAERKALRGERITLKLEEAEDAIKGSHTIVPPSSPEEKRALEAEIERLEQRKERREARLEQVKAGLARCDGEMAERASAMRTGAAAGRRSGQTPLEMVSGTLRGLRPVIDRELLPLARKTEGFADKWDRLMALKKARDDTLKNLRELRRRERGRGDRAARALLTMLTGIRAQDPAADARRGAIIRAMEGVKQRGAFDRTFNQLEEDLQRAFAEEMDKVAPLPQTPPTTQPANDRPR